MDSYFSYEKAGTVGHIVISDDEGRDVVATYGSEHALRLYERVVSHFNAGHEDEVRSLRARVAEVERERDEALRQTAIDRQQADDMTATAGTLAERCAILEADAAVIRAKYQFMVERAADRHLDGYRELGAKAATAETERDAARSHARECSAALERVSAQAAVMREVLKAARYAFGDTSPYARIGRAIDAALAPDAGSDLLEERLLLKKVIEVARTLKVHLKACARYGYADGVARDRRRCTCPHDKIRAALAALDTKVKP